MWNYEKRLQYPINITTPNAKLASYIMSQYGGPDGDDIDIISLNQQESRKKAGFRRFSPEKNSQRKHIFFGGALSHYKKLPMEDGMST
jgi:Mn-containing catalase